jgi:hypothetical protein
MTRGLAMLAPLLALQAFAPDARCDEPWHAGVGFEAFASHDGIGMAATAALTSRVSLGVAARYGVLTDTASVCAEESTSAGEATADGSDCEEPTGFGLELALRALVVDLPAHGNVSQPAFAQPFVSLGLGPSFDFGF